MRDPMRPSWTARVAWNRIRERILEEPPEECKTAEDVHEFLRNAEIDFWEGYAEHCEE